ncbi:hypothetical protein PROH_02350, partial [Prochlorothrix hollandica PCC 9006 = CALU 1027]
MDGTTLGGATATGDISLVADTRNLASTIPQSTGKLTIAPYTRGTDFTPNFGTIPTGFSSFTIGSATTGTVNLTSSVTLGVPTTILGTTIALANGVALNTGTNDLTLNASQNILLNPGSSLTASSLNLTAGTGIGTSAAPLQVSTTNLTVKNTGTGDLSLINTSSNATTLNQFTAAAGNLFFSQTGGGDLTVGNVGTGNGTLALTNTSGALTLTQPVTLTGATTLAGTSLTLGGAISGNQDLVLNSSGTTTLNGAIAVASLTTDAGGTTQVGANITTSGDMSLGDATTLDTSGGSVLLSGEDGITVGSVVTLGQPLTLTSAQGFIQTGTIDTSSPIGATTGNLNLSAATSLNTQAITSSGSVTLAGGTGVTVPSITALGQQVTISSPGSIVLTSLNTTGATTGTTTLKAGGAISVGNLLSGGSVLLASNGAINLGTVSSSGQSLSLRSNQSSISASVVNTTGSPGGSVGITAAGGVSLGSLLSGGSVSVVGNQGVGISSLTALGQSVALTSGGGSISVGAVNNQGSTATALAFQAAGTLTTGNVLTSGRVDFGAGGDLVVGDITAPSQPLNLTSNNGQIIAGNLSTRSTTGGAIFVNAYSAITTQGIDASGTVGNGGNVTLDPIGDVQVAFINAQGGAAGVGGAVDITAGRFFRATGTFVDNSGAIASISTLGSLGSGGIILNHGGGTTTTFTIGNASLNGTAGILNSGFSRLNVGEFYLGRYSDSNVSLVTEGVPLGSLSAFCLTSCTNLQGFNFYDLISSLDRWNDTILAGSGSAVGSTSGTTGSGAVTGSSSSTTAGSSSGTTGSGSTVG